MYRERAVCAIPEMRDPMRILVVSDTHGDLALLREVLIRQRSAEVALHLGDGADEFNMLMPHFPEKMFLGVRGNCDFGSALARDRTVTLEGKRIFLTHGYAQAVKTGRYELLREARAQKADICLYGHTHRAVSEYEDGLYILNPGSLSRNRSGGSPSYGLIDITEGGVFINVVSYD